MSEPIIYIDRLDHKQCQELVYGDGALKFLYGTSFLSRWIGRPLNRLVANTPFLSKFYGFLQRTSCSKRKVLPFIQKYGVDTSEFESDPSLYKSFNDFFIRKLKPTARPIAENPTTAVIPADARYLFFQNIDEVDGFLVKGKKFTLAALLQSETLAKDYEGGSMAIARLCPTDYHRYHFPVECTPGSTYPINGTLYSVNPIALKDRIEIFAENKRTLCTLDSKVFGNVLFLEIGATFVGAIHQTYKANLPHAKGDEKGYFSFGGSSLIVLFKKGAIRFDQDLLEATAKGLEIRCLMGQSMGISPFAS